MTKSSNENFIKEGLNWYTDRYEAIKVERNRYFVLLLAAIAALIVSLLAMLMLTPLKTAVPYVIEIDKSTGITTALQPTDAHSMRENTAVTIYFLYKYLNARMNYDWDLRQVNADTVRALSAAQSYALYAAYMDINNPQSPIKRYGANNKITVAITSHSFPYPNIAEIHFYTEMANTAAPANNQPLRQYWIATIKYTYSNTNLTVRDRENINPLGFFVTNFQLNQETPGGITP